MQIIRLLMLVLVGLGLYKMTQRRYPPHAEKHPESSDLEGIAPDLHHPNWRARLAAVQALRDSRDESAISDLLEALSDEDNDVRVTARTALEAIGKAAIDGLLDVLREGRLEARVEAAQALGTIGDPAAVDGLSAALDDESEWVRVPAADSLRQIGTRDALSAIEQHAH